MSIRHFVKAVVFAMPVAALAGCSGSPVQLYAYEGPIAAAHPDLVITARSQGQQNTGTFAYALPDGAMCSGTWMRTTNKNAANFTKSTLSMLEPGSGRIAKDGNISASGEGGRVFHGGNGAEGLGAGNCNNGATFMFAFVANGVQSRGALKDSNGNIFKIAVR